MARSESKDALDKLNETLRTLESLYQEREDFREQLKPAIKLVRGEISKLL